MNLCPGPSNVHQETPWYQQGGWKVLLLGLHMSVSCKGRPGFYEGFLPLPLASAAAVAEHSEHNFDEQEISLRK